MAAETQTLEMKGKNMRISVICTVSILLASVVCHAEKKATAQTGDFVNLNFTVDGVERSAALYIPEGYDKTKKWPLVIYLHGGGRGGDNKGDALPWGKGIPIAQTIEKHPEWFPALVLIPRCPSGKLWAPGPKDPTQSPWRLKMHGRDPKPDAADHITAAIDETIAEYSIDEDRITMMGFSMGGEGTTLYAPLHADRIAAIAPSAGSAIIVPEHAPILAKMGVWIFQGERDAISTAELARQMVEAIKEAGGDVRYTELKGVGHGSLGPMLENDKVFKWLLSQKRRKLAASPEQLK